MVNENHAKVAKLSEEHKSPYLGKKPGQEPVHFKDNTRGETELPVMIDENK
ncbi:hypothetical protein ACFOU2_11625 [Bacillus songklensis]|uniref:Uncharacterized protein n=1 Tax=Bacillus songklensis TaxID=1069116 RepID=A0ABV8B2L3_9BACI